MSNISKIINIMNNSKSITLLFINKLNNSPEFELGRMQIHESIFNNIRELYAHQAESMIKDKREIKLDPMNDNQDSVHFLNNNEIKGIESILEPLKNINTVEPVHYKDAIAKANAFAFVFTLDKEKVIIIRKLSSNYSLKNKNVFFSDDNRLNKVDKDLFALDNKIDCLIYEDKTYILGKYNFEVLFSYDTEYMNVANISLTKISENKIITNFDEFKENCLSRGRLIKKLYKIEKDGYIDKFNKCIKNPGIIKKMDSAIKELQLSFHIENNQIVYEDISTLSEIINFISNDYLRSFYTEDAFVASSKIEHGK